MAETSVRVEGLSETIAGLEQMKRATQKNVVRRALLQAGEITANAASRLAPVERGVLSFSIVVSKDLTRRHKRQRERASEVEVYIGPAGGQGALFYAAFQEFGTVNMPARPYLRPAWDGTKVTVLAAIQRNLGTEIGKAQRRAARKAARLAAA